MLNYISEIKKVGYDKQLNEITNKLPSNKQICETILEKLNNKTVTIKEDDGKEASLYIVMNNSILIANIKNSFTRVQTIAHECLHSVQNKKIVWFNFIFSNIYIFYFLTITILSLFNKTKNNTVLGLILIIAGFIFYVVRSYLEMDAMIKARYLAEEYFKDNENILTNGEIQLILKKYDYINDIGIKLTLLLLAGKCLIKLLIFTIACLI